MLQWNGYEPGSEGAVKFTVDPPSTSLQSNSPLSAVTVCANPSSFRTVTFAPLATVIGENAKSLIDNVPPASAAMPLVHSVSLLSELPLSSSPPQAASPSASTTA